MSITTKFYEVSEGNALNGKIAARNKVGPSVKFYTDFEITTTDRITDYATQAYFDASANANITTIASGAATNSTEVLCSAAASPDSGSLFTALGTSSFLYFASLQVDTASAFIGAALGALNAGARLSFNSSGITVADGSNSVVISYTGSYVSTDDVLVACFFDGSTLYLYESEAGASITAAAASADASSLSSITLPGTLTLSSSVGQNFYSAGLVAFDSTPTQAQVIAWLNTINSNYTSSDKKLPDGWIIPV